MNKFMKLALQEAKEGIENNEGGPFGAVIVKNGKIIGKGHNRVVLKNDPTAHAEIEAIRDACKNINSFSLEGCEIYTTCEPCPMCFSAIHWARLDKVYYGATKEIAAKIGFDDKFIYDILKGEKQDIIKFIQIDIKSSEDMCLEWDKKEDKILY